jgi:hypothetical protein
MVMLEDETSSCIIVSDDTKTRHSPQSSIIAHEESTGDLVELLTSASIQKSSITSSYSMSVPSSASPTYSHSIHLTNTSVRIVPSNEKTPSILKRTSSYVSMDSANKLLDMSKSDSIRRRDVHITFTGLEMITKTDPDHSQSPSPNPSVSSKGRMKSAMDTLRDLIHRRKSKKEDRDPLD